MANDGQDWDPDAAIAEALRILRRLNKKGKEMGQDGKIKRTD